jgi:hypothetical protein
MTLPLSLVCLCIVGIFTQEGFSLNVGETRMTKLRVWGEPRELGRATERIVGGNMEVSIEWTLDQLEAPLIVSLPYFADAGGLSESLWPAGIAGSILLRSPDMKSRLQNQRVIELGSGVGLAGLVAATSCKTCLLTDNTNEAVGFLESAIQRNTDNGILQGCEMTAMNLDWRDQVENVGSADVVLGTDVAYYYHLLRPLMDTSTAHLSTDGLMLVLGQANRQSQWDLYKNIKDGCYNQITDEHEPAWIGDTRMLLYVLEVGCCQKDGEEHSDEVYDMIPMAALLHSRGDEESVLSLLAEYSHVATKEDEESIAISF